MGSEKKSLSFLPAPDSCNMTNSIECYCFNPVLPMPQSGSRDTIRTPVSTIFGAAGAHPFVKYRLIGDF
jgi:hypothetical protein